MNHTSSWARPEWKFLASKMALALFPCRCACGFLPHGYSWRGANLRTDSHNILSRSRSYRTDLITDLPRPKNKTSETRAKRSTWISERINPRTLTYHTRAQALVRVLNSRPVRNHPVRRRTRLLFYLEKILLFSPLIIWWLKGRLIWKYV